MRIRLSQRKASLLTMAATGTTIISPPSDGDTNLYEYQQYEPRGSCRKSGSARIRQVTCCSFEAWASFRELYVPSYLQTRCRYHQPPFRRPRPNRLTPRFDLRMPARSGTSSSSMHTATSFSSSTFALNSSPSRQSPNRQSPSRHGRAHRSSIIRDPRESPHRQLSVDFDLILRLSDRDRNTNEKLDLAAAERAKIHAEQLAKAAEEHARVRRSAQLELNRLELVALNERLDREEKERLENERLQREAERKAAEARQKELEAKQRAENAARQAVEHERKLKEVEEQARVQREQAALQEKQKQEKADADRKTAEAAAAAAKTQQPQPVPQPVTQPAAVPVTVAPQQQASVNQNSGAEFEAIHAKYLELHLRMKQFRVSFWNEHKKTTSPLKAPVGDARRAIRTRLGQINIERKDSVAAIKRLREECFDKALSTPGPVIDIRSYIVSHQVPQLSNEAEAAYPAMLLYVWICFEKFLLKQFEKEAANEDGRIIQEIGLIAASLLGDKKYMWKDIPMTDIVLAKLHKACPPLFGIRGTMDTAEGRLRLGFLPGQTVDVYSQRLRGIGAGWAAMTLRTFSGKPAAIPVAEYWRAVVCICNTPADALFPGHFSILNGLLRDYYKKFLIMYGVPARAVLRRAVIDLPARAPARCKDAAASVRVLSESWKKERIVLE